MEELDPKFSARIDRVISLALLAAILALAVAAALGREEGPLQLLFFTVAAVAAGGFLAKLRQRS